MLECEKFVCRLAGRCLFEKEADCKLTIATCGRADLLSCEKCAFYKWCTAKMKYKYKV